MKTGILLGGLLWGSTLLLHGQTPQDTRVEDSLRTAHLDSVIAARLPRGGNVAVYAYDLTDHRPLYAYQADKLGRPASNMKLLTTITALAQPEADAPFRTEVWTDGEVRGDTLCGNLYVVGGMDPELDEAALDSLVEQVAAHAFHYIKGAVCGDVSLRDSLTYGAGWCWDDIPYDYQPCLSPLMLCKGTVQVLAVPSAHKGEPALVEVRPASTYYIMENRTKSRTPEAGRFSVARNWMEQGNRITVNGNVEGRRGATLTVHDAAAFFMHTFVERLQAGGVMPVDTLTGEVYREVAYVWAAPADRAACRLLALHETPMQQVVEQVMKESDNLNTEAVLTRLGAQVTGRRHIHVEDGLAVVRALIGQIGLNPDHYRLADGCGLSNYNAVSPELLVAFLRFAYEDTGIFQKLYKALPVAGVDGTLKNRMKKGSPAYRNVHAKTGTISGISALSGYLQNRRGHWIAFSIMNQNQLSGSEARKMQDVLCEELVRGVD